MFSLGIKEFCRRIFSNLFIALQLAAVLFIIISIVSSVRSRIEYYEPIADQLKGEGLYAKLGGLATEEHFKEQFPQVESIFCAHSPALQINGIKTLKSYTQDVAEMYVPPLKEGKWISEIDVNSQTLYAVVNEKTGLKVGSSVKGTSIYYEPEDVTYTNPLEKKYTIEVVGIISDKTKFFGGDNYFEMEDDFRNLYGTGENKVFIMNKEQLDNIGVDSTITQQKMIIHFKDDLSEKEVKRWNNQSSGFQRPFVYVRLSPADTASSHTCEHSASRACFHNCHFSTQHKDESPHLRYLLHTWLHLEGLSCYQFCKQPAYFNLLGAYVHNFYEHSQSDRKAPEDSYHYGKLSAQVVWNYDSGICFDFNGSACTVYAHYHSKRTSDI